MHTVFVIGEPGTGKTSLVRSVLPLLGPADGKIVEGETHGTRYPERRVVVLGIYDGRLYEGTDALALHTQPQAVRMVQSMGRTPAYSDWCVLLEGDRYATPSFINAILEAGTVSLLALDVPPDIIEERLLARPDGHYAARKGTRPSKTWMKGRRTKIANLRAAFPTVRLPNVTPRDRATAIEVIDTLLS